MERTNFWEKLAKQVYIIFLEIVFSIIFLNLLFIKIVFPPFVDNFFLILENIMESIYYRKKEV